MGGDISHGSTVTKNYQGICDMILREIKCEGRKKQIFCTCLESGFICVSNNQSTEIKLLTHYEISSAGPLDSSDKALLIHTSYVMLEIYL